MKEISETPINGRTIAMRTKSIAAVAFCFCAATMLSSCATVIFSTVSTFGVELSAAEGGQPGARVGYNRFEGVTMPHRYVEGKEDPKTYSVRSISEFESGPLFLPTIGEATRGVKVIQVFATGEAASSNLKENFEKLKTRFDPTPAP